MSFEVDPEGYEVRALEEAAEWRDRDVLEIGCGDGRLARRVAGLGAVVTGIDRDAERMRSALASRDRRTRYAIGDGQGLPFADENFDIVIFGWSL
jgi:ubiquinone/menaquinone biosynthesis C-methylase UbiE